MSSFNSLGFNFSEFTNKETYSNILEKVIRKESLVKINSSLFPIKDIKKTEVNSSKWWDDAIEKIDSTVDLKKYTTPTKNALDTFKKIGEDIDKSIKESFLYQWLGITSADILCTTFCFLYSLLPCKTKDDIYNLINKVNTLSRTANSTIQNINNTTEAIGAAFGNSQEISVTNILNVKNATSNIFTNSNKNNIQEKIVNSAVIAGALATVINNAKILSNILKFALDYKIVFPDISGKKFWELSSAVLRIIQSMVIQALDEILTQIIKKVESLLKSFIPSGCFNNMATRLFFLLIQALNTMKGVIITEISNLLTSSEQLNNDFRNKVKQSALSLQILQFSLAIKKVSAHFLEIGKSCGVEPCSNKSFINIDDLMSKDIGDFEALKDMDIGEILFSNTKTKPNYLNELNIENKTNINELSENLVNSGLINTNNVVVTNDSITAIYDTVNKPPRDILNLINNGILNNILNDNYTIVNNNDNITVVYKTNRTCGE